jgi:hypothetical protein
VLTENWSTILIFSFVAVALVNGLLASCTPLYYKNRSMGHLSHSQLRIKQGTANFEHRLNVFAQSLVFSFVTFRIYLITLLVWLAVSGISYIALSFK